MFWHVTENNSNLFHTFIKDFRRPVGKDLAMTSRQKYTPLCSCKTPTWKHAVRVKGLWPCTACVKWRADDLKTVKHCGSDIKRWWTAMDPVVWGVGGVDGRGWGTLGVLWGIWRLLRPPLPQVCRGVTVRGGCRGDVCNLCDRGGVILGGVLTRDALVVSIPRSLLLCQRVLHLLFRAFILYPSCQSNNERVGRKQTRTDEEKALQ